MRQTGILPVVSLHGRLEACVPIFAARPFRNRTLQHQVHKMGRIENAPRPFIPKRLGDRALAFLLREPSGFAHPPQHRLLPAFRSGGICVRIQPRRIPRQPREQRGFGIAQIRERLSQIMVRRLRDAEVEVPEIEPVQIRREDFLLRPKLLQPHRRRHLDKLRP